jgi:hypothetical protein
VQHLASVSQTHSSASTTNFFFLSCVQTAGAEVTDVQAAFVLQHLASMRKT